MSTDAAAAPLPIPPIPAALAAQDREYPASSGVSRTGRSRARRSHPAANAPRRPHPADPACAHSDRATPASADPAAAAPASRRAHRDEASPPLADRRHRGPETSVAAVACPPRATPACLPVLRAHDPASHPVTPVNPAEQCREAPAAAARRETYPARRSPRQVPRQASTACPRAPPKRSTPAAPTPTAAARHPRPPAQPTPAAEPTPPATAVVPLRAWRREAARAEFPAGETSSAGGLAAAPSPAEARRAERRAEPMVRLEEPPAELLTQVDREATQIAAASSSGSAHSSDR
jgi:hypothetical protein